MNKYILILALPLLISCKNPKTDIAKKTSEGENSPSIQLTTPKKSTTKNAEIVFCLDATGSMSGLIGTAKEKIWDIVSDLAQSNDIDTLRMGMVFYRDRGDAFVTKQIQLTTDLDAVYSDLLEMTADGGGDTPESVNQALNESVNEIQWSNSPNTYRTIFVVGDCPPHMDYSNDVLYTESCKKAAEKRITINTIKLGSGCAEAIPHFKKMASCTNGEFLQLDQDATDITIATPYDDKINKTSRAIDDSRLYYGNKAEQALNNNKKQKSLDVYDKGSATANSARASYKSSKSGRKSWMGSKEIISEYKSGKIALDEVSDDELPTVLKGKSTTEKEQILKELTTTRDQNIVKLKELNQKRREYIEQKTKENASSSDSLSFSKEVLKVMKKQANRN